MKIKRKSALLACLIFVLSLSGCDYSNETEKTVTVDLKEKPAYSEDEKFDISPADDFYGYVNANDLWNEEFKYGGAYSGGMYLIDNDIDDEVTGLLNEIINSDKEFEDGSEEEFIRSYYSQVKDFYQNPENRSDQTSEFDKVFNMIDKIRTPDDVMDMSAFLLTEYGTQSAANAFSITNPFKTDERILDFTELGFTGDIKKFKKNDREKTQIRNKYRDCLIGFGVDDEEAVKRADSIVYFFIDCVKDYDPDVDDSSIYNLYSEDEMKELFSNIDFEKYIRKLGITEYPYEDYNVDVPEELKTINSYLTDDNIQMWKDFFKCRFVMTYALFAPASYLNYDNAERKLTDKEILDKTANDLSTIVSALYCRKYYTEEYNKAMLEMSSKIKEAYVKMIRQSDMISDEGKELLVKKFNNISFYFGGDKRIDDEDFKDKIGENFFITSVNCNKTDFDEIGKEVDHSEWPMMSHEVNACYVSPANSIYIPRGIMHSPEFDINRSFCENLGALGVTICHELSHAFDPDGIKYDEKGQYDPEWISKADREAFEKEQERVVDFYNSRTLMDVYHIDGRKTLNENFADLGALQCVLLIADTKEEKKQIFENYAKEWSVLMLKSQVINSIKYDEHSPSQIRVNAVVMNMNDFYDVYDIKEGDKMYVAPENRVKRW